MDLNQQRDDPHGVQRLLDILRRQQDASSSSAAPPSNPFATAPQPEADAHTSSDAAAQRRRTYASSSSAYTPAEAPFDPYAFNPFSATNPVLDAPPAAPPKKDAPRDLASLSFAESLPILSGLAADAGLMRRLKMLRTQQRELERRLAKEYHQFAATKERQYPHIKQRKEEDHRRRADALAQWDKCLQAQQQELARAGVPTFVPTTDRRKVETQRKVLAVLVDMLDDQEPS